jgi:hypothetical protein
MNAGILVAVLIYEVVIILGVGMWLAKREASHPRREGAKFRSMPCVLRFTRAAC